MPTMLGNDELIQTENIALATATLSDDLRQKMKKKIKTKNRAIREKQSPIICCVAHKHNPRTSKQNSRETQINRQE